MKNSMQWVTSVVLFNLFGMQWWRKLEILSDFIQSQGKFYSCMLSRVNQGFIQAILMSTAILMSISTQHSSDQKKILKDQNAQTTARVVNVAYRLWLPFLINRLLNWTKLRSLIYDQSIGSSCFALWGLTVQLRSKEMYVFTLYKCIQIYIYIHTYICVCVCVCVCVCTYLYMCIWIYIYI